MLRSLCGQVAPDSSGLHCRQQNMLLLLKTRCKVDHYSSLSVPINCLKLSFLKYACSALNKWSISGKHYNVVVHSVHSVYILGSQETHINYSFSKFQKTVCFESPLFNFSLSEADDTSLHRSTKSFHRKHRSLWV